MFVHYDENGEILFVVEGDAETNALNGDRFLETGEEVNDTTHYVGVTTTPHGLKRKLELSPLVEVEGFGAALSGIPAGLDCKADGVSFTSEVENHLTFSFPGTYQITIRGGIYYTDAKLEVEIG